MSRDFKKFGGAAVAAFVSANVLDFVVHGILLKGIYQHPWYRTLWNSPEVMHSRMPLMMAGYAIASVAFTWIYTRGYEDAKPALGQGLRYGFWVGLLAPVDFAFSNYMVYPVSIRLAGAWAATGLIESMILGAVVALIYRPKL